MIWFSRQVLLESLWQEICQGLRTSGLLLQVDGRLGVSMDAASKPDFPGWMLWLRAASGMVFEVAFLILII